MLQTKRDRRLFTHAMPAVGNRVLSDRRGSDRESDKSQFSRFQGQRYLSDFPVKIFLEGKKDLIILKSRDISQTGILLQSTCDDKEKIRIGEVYRLKFKIPKGTMLEGMEKHITIGARCMRVDEETNEIGFHFLEPIFKRLKRRQDRYQFSIAITFLFLISLFIILLRLESVLYFKFNRIFYLYSIVAAIFLLSRYVFASFYRPIPIDPDYTPGVTIVIPCFNEEEWIQRTILSCIDQDYPVDKIEVIIVDDCSNDGSVEKVKEIVALLLKETDYLTEGRISYHVQPENKGKREAMAVGIGYAKHDFVTFVDSDSFLEPDAIRHLVQPMWDPKVAGVSGRTDVANAYENSLTKMQAVRYYIAFRVMKAAEAYFDSVMCLSGPLACYRKSVLNENLDKWLGQTFLGQRATFGDDRSMTNLIVTHNRTFYQDTAICSTIVPTEHKVFLKQQMRWKRSWLRESIVAAKFIWRKEPFMSIFFYLGLLIPVIAPIIVLYNLIYVPIVNRIFPTTFLVGMLAMAFMMSFAQLLLKKSSLWLYGLWFCIYYELVLLWQMPWAWVTFWVANWGTRMTPQDLEAEQRRQKRKGTEADV